MWRRQNRPNIASKGVKPKYVVGVDGALRNVGVVVFDNLGNKLAHTVIKTVQGWHDHQSIDHIVEHFFEFVNPYLLHNAEGRSLCSIYIEHNLFATQGKSTARAEVGGVLKWNLRQERHSCFGVTPNAVNSFIGNKFGVKYPGGRGDGLTSHQRTKRIKQLTMETLHLHCNFYTRDDNLADAYAIGLFGIAHAVEKRHVSAIPLFKLL